MNTINRKRLVEVLELPGCTGTRNSGAGSYCALGKLVLLIGDQEAVKFEWENREEVIKLAKMNNYSRFHESLAGHGNDYNFPYAVPHGKPIKPGNKQWLRHLAATVRAIKLAYRAGKLKLTKDAKEYLGL